MEPRGNRMYKFNESYIGLRSDLLKFISGANLNVLDVGCATGVNGAYLIENGIAKKVVGVEYDIGNGGQGQTSKHQSILW